MKHLLTLCALVALSALALAEGVEPHTYWRTHDGHLVEVKHRGTTFGDRAVKGRGITGDGTPTTEWSDPASGTPDAQGEVTESATFYVGDTRCKIGRDTHRVDSSLYTWDPASRSWKRATETKVPSPGRDRNSPTPGRDGSTIGGLPDVPPGVPANIAYVPEDWERDELLRPNPSDPRSIAPVC